MKGKNKGKTYTCSGRGTGPTPPEEATGCGGQKTAKAKVHVPCNDFSSSRCSSLIPAQVGTDLSFFQPADDGIDTSLLLPVLKCEFGRCPATCVLVGSV